MSGGPVVLACLLFGGWVSVVHAAELISLDARAVVAWPAQMLREQPAGDARAVVRVPFGEQVTVVSSAEAGPCTTLAGVEGCWRQVHWGVHRGWMFDGWLVSLPAPPALCDGFDSWVALWKPEGPEVIESDGSRTGEVVRWRVQSYEGGLHVARPADDWSLDPSAVHLWLPGIDLVQAWFVARRCHPGLAPIAESGWPPQGRGGLQVRRAEGQLQVRAQDAVLLDLEQREDGVYLIWR